MTIQEAAQTISENINRYQSEIESGFYKGTTNALRPPKRLTEHILSVRKLSVESLQVEKGIIDKLISRLPLRRDYPLMRTEQEILAKWSVEMPSLFTPVQR